MIRRAVRKRSPPTCVAGSMPSSRSLEDPARDGKSKRYTNYSSNKIEKCAVRLPAGREPPTSSPKWENLGKGKNLKGCRKPEGPSALGVTCEYGAGRAICSCSI